MDGCSVFGCQNPAYVKAKRLCSKHYNRLRTTGTTDDGPQARLPLEQRFWKHVDVRSPDECWPWTAKSKISGYGVISTGGRRGKKVLAHRLSWQIHNGDMPESDSYHGAVVMHTCDNPECVNPSHLVVGEQADNVDDMIAKGRKVSNPPCGERHKNSKLTDEQVRQIKTSKISGEVLAKKYGCNRCTINRIRSGKSWKHV